MKRCPNCGKISGSHSSAMQECRCQYSMQAPTPPIATQHERKPLMPISHEHMTTNEIKNLFMYYGQSASGKDFALISAIESIVSQKRLWVWLTDEDIADATGIYPTMQPDKWHETVEIARAIEAKLKEKNEAAQN